MVSDNVPVINNVISSSNNASFPTEISSEIDTIECTVSSGASLNSGVKQSVVFVPKRISNIQSISIASAAATSATTQSVVQSISNLQNTLKTETVHATLNMQPSHTSTTNPIGGHLTPIKGSDVKVILPQTASTSQTNLVSVPQINTNSAISAALKRTPSSTMGNQVITKVIITSNPATNQSTTPISGSISAGTAGTLIASDNLGQQQSAILLASPTKAFTVSKPVVGTVGTPRIIRSVPNTPPKQGVVVLSKFKGKVPSPISFVKSPQRIAPAPNAGNLSSIISGSKVTIVTAAAAVSSPALSTTMAKPITVPASPTKVILKPVVPTTLKPTTSNSTSQSSTTVVTSIDNSSLKQVIPTTGNAMQQIQVPGSKFHYVRLVSAPTTPSTSTTGTKQTAFIPVTTRPVATTATSSIQQSTATPSVVNVSSGTPVRITLPITPVLPGPTQVSSKPAAVPQRMIIPASSVSSVSQVRANSSVQTVALRQLPAGTLIPAGGGILMVPAQYNITQLQQTNQSQSNSISGTQMVIQSAQPQSILPSPSLGNNNNSTVQQTNFVPVASATSNQIFEQSSPQTLLSSFPRHHINGRTAENGDSRPRKPCNCTKSQCLKLYCDCFANGEFCNNCNCNNCSNNLEHEEERQKAIKACLDRNPLAFHPKIGKGKDGDHERRHTKGCNCKRSGCLKNYCECYEAKILCTNLCKCVGCKNFEDSSERKTLMHLADAAEVRVQQQAAAKTKISSQIQDLPTRPPIISTTGERLPFAFITQEVVEATCHCLLAQAEDGERSALSVSTLERLVLEEFGRCLKQIIEYANKTKVSTT